MFWYVGEGVVPPEYPTLVDITPFATPNIASGHQKHPIANVAVSSSPSPTNENFASCAEQACHEVLDNDTLNGFATEGEGKNATPDRMEFEQKITATRIR
mmetsp:Transcript_25223/g.32907  ORF Transcript_25223/g.32907 Transcript_25223/m.32907 type:complete len:100 (+) Transcript_25223:1173-1472(+)